MKDYTEYEAKFYPVDKEKFRKKLQMIGADLVIAERKMIRVVADYYANPVIGKNNNIRIRDEGNVVRLSLKSETDQSGKLSDQKEIDVEVSNFDDTKKIFEAVGIKFNRRQETMREEWSLNGAQIVIDTWPGLETYTEIEAKSEAGVKDTAEKLGFDWSRKIIVSAPGIYSKVYEMDIHEVLEKISNITFKNCPFDAKKRKPYWI